MGGETTLPGSGQRADGRRRVGLIITIYLLGLLIGGLYVGIISPIRTVIQQGMGLNDTSGIWMINIYTLFYAATIPISGKLADRYGCKRVFTTCIGLFAIGAGICGLSATHIGFGLLLFGRMVQAAGAGGIIPVATAEVGTTAPPERRGAALGVAAAVAGLANVLGSVVGSALLGLIGNDRWALIFYVALPVCALVIVGALIWLPNHTEEAVGKLDLGGSFLLFLFVLMLLLGIKDVDFFDLSATAGLPSVWIPLICAVVIAVVFPRIERRASDPVFHMEFFANRQIVVTMIASLFIGGSIISMVLIPEFAERALGLVTGSGGYYLAVIGIFAIAGPPLTGALIDRIGAKPVLMIGLTLSMAGFIFLATLVCADPTPVTMMVGLAIVGLGMGFSMGAPLNYMILTNTEPEDSNSAIATLALIRQMGTTLAPAILVGFIASSNGLSGFSSMLLVVAAFNAISLVTMLFYRGR